MKIANPITDFISVNNVDTTSSTFIHKIECDMNGDGLKDIALTVSKESFSAGGTWSFYLKSKDKKYIYYDTIGVLHPSNVSFLKNKWGNYIMIFLFDIGYSGAIHYYYITPKGFKHFKTKKISDDVKSTNEFTRIVNKEIATGRKGLWSTATLRCVMSNQKKCWTTD